jgi:hypothetical protein
LPGITILLDCGFIDVEKSKRFPVENPHWIKISRKRYSRYLKLRCGLLLHFWTLLSPYSPPLESNPRQRSCSFCTFLAQSLLELGFIRSILKSEKMSRLHS